MCEQPARRGAAAAMALLCAAPITGLQAQDATTARALLTRLRAAQAAEARRRHAEDSLRTANTRVDTVRVGALVVLSAPGVPTALAAGAAGAWAALDARFGARAHMLTTIPFVLGITGSDPLVPHPPLTSRGIGITADADSASLTRALASAAAFALAEHEDAALREWLGTPISAFPAPAQRFAEVYVELATAPWTAVRRCHGGDLDDCRRMLGLVPGEGYLDQWYDPEDRRRLVAMRSGPIERWTPLHRSCVDGHSADACTALLRADPDGLGQPPTTATLRSTVMDVALELGSPGAYDRLLAAPDRPLTERLEAAATVSSDSLLRAWYARTMLARPKTVTVGAPGAWAAFGWVTALVALALRSSRWR